MARRRGVKGRPSTKRASLKTVRKLRGGFTPSGTWRQKGAQAAWGLASTAALNALKKTAAEAGVDFAKASAALKKAKLPKAAEVRKRIAGTIYSVADDAISGGKGDVPFVQGESTRVRNIGSVGMNQKRHITRFEAGKLATRTNRQLCKMHGTTTDVLLDTIRAATYSSGTALRNHLTQVTGFNQKFIGLPNFALWTAKDFHDAFTLANYSPPATKLQRNLVATTKLGRTLTILNTGRYIKSHVTIKLYRNIASHQVPRTIYTQATSSVAEIAGVQIEGKMPQRYQLEGYTNEGENGFTYMRTDPMGSLAYAPAWTDSMEFVRSFKKVLEPGESWEWTEILHCGAGLDLGVLNERYANAVTASFGYVPVIEFHGPKVLGCYAANSDENFIGTAPSYIQFECKKWHETCNASHNTNTGWASSNTGGIITDRYMVRSFTKKQDEDSKIFNVDISNITDDPTDTAAGRLFIPVMTETNLAYAERSREGGTGGA